MKRILVLLAFALITLPLAAQITVRGVVTSQTADPEPIGGATVYAPNLQLGTTTDSLGKWELTLDQTKFAKYVLLQFRSVGFQSAVVTVQLNGQKDDYRTDISLRPEVYQLEGLVVRSVRVEEREPFVGYNLSGDQLRSRNIGQDMPFLLRFTPSAVVTSDAGSGFGYNGMRIRGSDATRTNVTINGIPLNDSESQGTFWVNLPDFASSVSSVQIQRGVGTSTNGAGAFGAGVHLSTLRLHEDAYGRLSQSYGSFNSRKTALEFGTGLTGKQFSIDGRISRIHSDGYIDRASADQESYYLSAGWWGRKSNVQAIVFHGQERTYQAWFGVPAQYAEQADLRTYNPAGQRSDGTFHDDQVDNYQQTHYQLHYQQSLPDNWALHLAGHYTRGAGYFEEYKDRELEAALFSPEATFSFYGLANPIVGGDTLQSTDLIRRRWLDNHYVGTVFSLEHSATAWTLTLGGAASRYFGRHYGELIWARFASNSEKGFRYYDADADKTDANVYGKIDWSFTTDWSAYLDLQIRHVDYSLEGLDNSRTDRHRYTFFNPKVGLSWQSGPTSRLFLSLAVAQREPGRFDFLDAGPDRIPRPEQLVDLELGWKKSWSKASLAINAFGMYYHDQLALTGTINQDALPVRVNIPKSSRIGAEISGNWQVSSALNLSGSAALSDNRIASFTEFIDNWDTGQQESVLHTNTHLAFSPPHIADLSAEYLITNLDHLQLSAQLISKYVGRQYIDNTSRIETSLDPYWFSDVVIRFDAQTTVFREFSASLLVRNAFDARFSSNAWTYRYISGFDARPSDPYARLEQGNTYNLTGFFPQAGRNIMVSLTVGF